LTPGADADPPGSGITQRPRGIDAQLGHSCTPAPPCAAGAPLVAVPPHEVQPVGVGAGQVAETGNVDPVRAAALIVAVEEPRDLSAGPHPEMMIHEVAPQRAAVAAEPVGMLR